MKDVIILRTLRNHNGNTNENISLLYLYYVVIYKEVLPKLHVKIVKKICVLLDVDVIKG